MRPAALRIFKTAALIVLFALPTLLCAQSTELSGVWSSRLSDYSRLLGRELPLTPYGLERLRTVDQAKDPPAACLPAGPIRTMHSGMPFQFVQSSKEVVILFEYQATFRIIYTDGRSHPADIKDYPEWQGHSVGHWEGDTLVVETVGINELTKLDTVGHEHSIEMRMVERFQRTDADTIKWTVTIEDPVFFTEPWTVTTTMKRENTRIMSYSCEENEKDLIHMLPTIGPRAE